MSTPKWDDTEEIPSSPDVAPKWDDTEDLANISSTESAIRGAVQGASLGFADEATAGVESLFTDKTYAQARDESRAAYEAAKNANPNTYLTGELGGGVATAFIPGLNLAKGASLAKMAAQGAGIGAAAGLGSSVADLTEGDIGGAIADTAIGAGLGLAAAPVIAAVPKVASLGVKGLKGTGEFLVEKTPGARSLIDSFKRARAGEKIASKEALAAKTASLQDVIEKEITPALKAVEGGEEAAVKTLQKDYQASQKMIEDYTDDMLKLEAKQQTAVNKENLQNIVKETVDTAEGLQKTLKKQKEIIGKQFDFIDNEAAKSGMNINLEPAAIAFGEALANKSALNPRQQTSLIKKLVPLLGKEQNFDTYRQAKRILNDFSGHADPGVRAAVSSAKAELSASLNNSIQNAKRPDLQSLLNDANKKWSAINEVEDRFVEGLNPNRVVQDQLAEGKTIQTVKSFGQPENDLSVNKAQNFQDMLKKLLPAQEIPRLPPELAAQESAESIIQKLQGLGERRQGIESFKPLVAAKDEALAANPEYQQIKDLLAKSKQEVPEIFPRLFGNKGQENVASLLETPGAQQDLQQIFKNSRVGTESTKVEAQLDLDKMFDAISKTNPEQATALKAKLTDMSRGLELSEKSLKTSLLDNGSLLHKAMGTGEAGAIRLGEGLGAGTKAVSDASGKALAKTGETLSRLIGNDAFVAKLPEMANHFASKGMGKFAAMLNKIHSSPIGMRKALIYTLVQEPEFRREIKKFNLEPVK